MATIDHSYVKIWRDFLTYILLWPDCWIEDFVERWQLYEDTYGPRSLLYHDFELDCVIPLAIPESLRKVLRANDCRELAMLENHLRDLVTCYLHSSTSLDDRHWKEIRSKLTAALGEWQSAIPSANESFTYWHDYRRPSVESHDTDGTDV